ncbi:hypothetical protein [Paenibacillus lacisoli]|nr:hypothetical protein [Paenibacillus sp. JX-17]
MKDVIKTEQHIPDRVMRYICEQTADQPVTRLGGALTCRFAYGRASETADAEEPGQDFLGIWMQRDLCSFVLCDGVGQSFQGDFAARYLGTSLLDWLAAETAPSLPRLQRKLELWTGTATEQLERETALEHVPALLRHVLEDKKKLGSQTMYVCGQLKLPSRKRRGRMWLAWQGDSRVRLWSQSRECSIQSPEVSGVSDRWSTQKGIIGKGPHIYETSLPPGQPMRLQLYSDGLSDLDAVQEEVPDDELQLLLQAEHVGGLEDDAAFIELKW